MGLQFLEFLAISAEMTVQNQGCGEVRGRVARSGGLAFWASVFSLGLWANGSLLQGAFRLTFGADSVWDHSMFGGPSASVGWSNTGVKGGSTTLIDPVTMGELTVTISYRRFGTVTERSGEFANFYTSGTFNGEDGTDRPALMLGQSNDYNAPGGPFANYSVATFTFSEAVVFDGGSFTFGDVDIGGGWRDDLAVEAFLGGAPVSHTLVPVGYPSGGGTAFRNQVVNGVGVFSDRDFPGGIVIGTSAADNDSDEGEIDVQFAGPVTEIWVYYWGGVVNGSAHSIYIQEDAIRFSAAVPEPAAGAIVMLAAVLVILRSRRR